MFTTILIAFIGWRRNAASYHGQDLHLIKEANDSVEILLIGDMGTGDEHQERIAQEMNHYCEQNPLAAVVFLGDNFYPHGVSSTSDSQWQEKFLKPYNLNCLNKLPFYALLGNHDYKGNTLAQIEFKSESPSWNMPHRFYDLSFGSLLSLTMLDTNILDLCGSETQCTIDFLLRSLEQSKAKFKLALGHHPIESSSAKYTGKSLQSRILEKLLCGRAHSYISGHSHHLEHLSSDSCQESLDYFIVGGGGADLYEVKEKKKSSKFAVSNFGFMALKADSNALRFRLIDGSSQILYETVRKIEN